LANADYGGYTGVPLVISIDYSGHDECGRIAEEFSWPFGPKAVLKHSENLGLREHIIRCGGLTDSYEGVILLEDDLFVSPAFYDYAQQAYDFYKDESQVAGIALYNYHFNETALCPFEPLSDGYDNYFMQVPCSSGQLWTRGQWYAFESYLEINDTVRVGLPVNVSKWPDKTSWKKFFYKYLIHSGKYFVYPRIGLTTNFGDIGEHFSKRVTVWQSPISIQRKSFRFSMLNDSLSLYDSYFELAKEACGRLFPDMADISFDINGTKDLQHIDTEFLISSKRCNSPIRKYAVSLYPYENNVILGVVNEDPDVYISYGRTRDFVNEVDFKRLPLDIARVFYNSDLITQQGREEVYRTHEYKIGSKIFSPFRKGRLIFRRYLS
jgi:hypothetical protein